MKRDVWGGCLCIGLASLVFSTMEVFLKLPAVAGAFHPMQITMERFLVGGICLLPLALGTLAKQQIHLTRSDLGFLAGMGLLNIPLAMVLYQLALTHGQANVVAVIFSGNPIFVTVLAFLLLGEAIHWNNFAALAAEVAGILIIIDPWGQQAVNLTSVTLAIIAALLFSLYSVLGKKLTARVGSIPLTCFAFLFGAGEMLALLLLGRTGFGAGLYQAVGLDLFCKVPLLQGINTATLPYFLFICIVNCAGGYVFHMLAVEKTGAVRASLVFFFKPILAPLFAWAVLGEAISRPIGLGILCFLSGSLLSILPELHRSKAVALPRT